MRILAQSGIALVVVMTASLVVATATPAEACTCEAERRLSADFSEMESVFTGKVIKIEPKAGDAAHNLVTISVFQPFRDDQNVLQGNVQVVTPASDAACGVRFKLDQAYLVYASRESAGDGARTRHESAAERVGGGGIAVVDRLDHSSPRHRHAGIQQCRGHRSRQQLPSRIASTGLQQAQCLRQRLV